MTFNHSIISYKVPINPEHKFSILIPSWNNLEILKICIDSINKNYGSYY